ncbi:hypothetical protein [Geothrix sp. 21YS21S-2]|uniref:hypothetical protein n=1 Tax=Geothrix sp. 21YS21S-2 TaxID=3068893 RepID=UPI0027B95F92|nr:hypothetical protein [Geothrix sp. 21YS21S-2]
MTQDLKAEDLIATEQDGTRRINHDLLSEYGLFNLPRPVMRSALLVYYENARRQGYASGLKVQTLINLTNAIARFPREVAINFTRGPAYHRNMKLLARYSK